MKPFTLERTVLPEHLDELNHVNNIQYLQWVQEAAKAHWEALTSGCTDEFEIWVVRSHHIEYKKAAQLNDVLTLTTYVKDSSGFLSERIVEVSLKSNNRLLARCSTQWCYLNKASNKLERIPEKVHLLFE
ncbi:MAG: acyl-CoA thioesterase [Flavobacteriaceae bacterium]